MTAQAGITERTENSPLAGWVVVALMIGGAALTALGLFALAQGPVEGVGWRWGTQYLSMFVVLALAVGAFAAWRGPLIGVAIVGLGIALAGGVLVPVSVVAGLSLSAYLLGRLVFRSPGMAATDHVLVGMALFGTLLSLLVHLPVNYPGTWGLLFVLPWLAGWRHLRALPSLLIRPAAAGGHLYVLHCAIGAALLLHFLVSLMPEVGHDALAMHLFIPATIAYQHVWSFDVNTYVWAVMPMLADWLYAAGYVLSGETAARLVNFGGLLLLAAMVYRFARWMGASAVAAAWGVLLFLLTPLTFTESSSLFIESIWTALLLGGMLAVLRLLAEPASESGRLILLGAVLLGGALAAKAVTFTMLPGVALVLIIGYRRWLSWGQLRALLAGFAILLMIGMVPYINAYVLTGNPVFPFFNALFRSPLYAPENFSPPAIFERGMAWNTLYRMTFESGKYLESTPGAAGFHWLLLVVPAIVGLALARHRRGLAVTLIAGMGLWLAFGQTAYLRYVFPSFALSCALVAPALGGLRATGRLPWRAGVFVAVAVVVLDLLHFNAGTYYGAIDPKVIADARARDAYIEKVSPVRTAVEVVNGLNSKQAPVAFFSSPLFSGLKTDPLSATWYNHRFLAEAQAARNPTEMGHMLARRNVDYVVVDEAWSRPELQGLVSQATTEVARIGSVSVRRLIDDYRFVEELLPSTTFESANAWGFTPGALRVNEKEVLASVDESAHIAVPVRPGGLYRYSAEVRCADMPGVEARLQVNWLRADGNFIYPDIQVFTCAAQTEKHTMDVRAPADAAQAVVYASGHTKQPVIFSSVSFRN